MDKGTFEEDKKVFKQLGLFVKFSVVGINLFAFVVWCGLLFVSFEFLLKGEFVGVFTLYLNWLFYDFYNRYPAILGVELYKDEVGGVDD